MSGHQLWLSELELGGRGPMRLEQVKCSCGNVSSKAAPSIKQNKKGRAADAGLIQHAGEGTIRNIQKLSKPFFFCLYLFRLFSFLTHAPLLLCQ